MSESTVQAGALKIISDSEVAGTAVMEQLGAYDHPDWNKYAESLHMIMEYSALFDRGEPPPDDEWHRALHELGEDRRQLANNAGVALRDRAAQGEAHLASLKHDFDQVIAALEDVQHAVEDAEKAAKLVELVMTLKDIAEVVEHPSPEKIAEVVTKRYTYDALIERGIGNLAQYGVDLTLVSHGFASVDELHRRVESAKQQVADGAEALQLDYHYEALARQYYEWPAYN
jgi:hypothetical protein